MKHRTHLSPEDEQRLARATEGLRHVAAPSPDYGRLAARMKQTAARSQAPTARFAFAGALVALLVVVTALVPRRSDAVLLQEALQAVKDKLERHELCYRVAPDGKATFSYEAWSKPGKTAMRFADGSDIRDNGQVSYIYYPTSLDHSQSIKRSSGDGLDPVGVEEYINSPYGKLLRVEKEGHGRRFVFQMGETRQDLVIDDTTKLPRRRDVYGVDGRLTEFHEYEFTSGLDDKLFDPDIKPGIPVVRSADAPASGTAANR